MIGRCEIWLLKSTRSVAIETKRLSGTECVLMRLVKLLKNAEKGRKSPAEVAIFCWKEAAGLCGTERNRSSTFQNQQLGSDQ